MRSVSVKLPLWTPWRHMGGVDVWLHTLTLAMETCGQLRAPLAVPPPLAGSHCIVDCISSRASLDASEQRKISYHCRESNHVAYSTVTTPTELSGSPSDGVNRKSWEAVTQCPAPHWTTALCSEMSHRGTLSSGVLTDTHSVTCSTLQQDDLVAVRGDAARPLFAKRGLVYHLQKTERICVSQRTAHSFPNILEFYENHWPRCSSTANTKPPLHIWQQCRHYIAHIHRLFRHTFNSFFCISHTRTAFEVRQKVVHFRGAYCVKYTYTWDDGIKKAFYAVQSGSTLTMHMETTRSAETLVPISHATTSV